MSMNQDSSETENNNEKAGASRNQGHNKQVTGTHCDQTSTPAESGSGVSRRGLFALAGLAGLSFMGSASATHGTGTSGFEDFDTIHLVGDGGGQYRTIQAAHDAIPGNGSNANGAILVTDSYDPSRENFPVVFTKYVDIRGMGNTAPIIYNDDPSANTFVFRASEQHNTESPMLSNLRFGGGRTAVLIRGYTNMTVQDVSIFDSSDDAIVVTPTPGSSPYDNYFRNINIADSGGDGIYVPHDAAINSLVFDNVNVYRAKNYGYQLRRGGAATTIRDSTIQRCNNWGLLIDRSAAFTVRDCYIESNGQRYSPGTGNRIDLMFQGQGVNENFLVEGCYFQAFNKGDTAIHINAGENGEIKNCGFNGYDGGYIVNDRGSTDLNVSRSTIETDGAEANFYRRGSPQGLRTRENEVITRQDLTDIRGLYDGDQGLHDGSGGGNSAGLAVWDESDGQWVSQVNGSVIR